MRISLKHSGAKRSAYVLVVVSCLFGLSACQQRMAQAPYFRSGEESEFFPDKRASRPLEYGTVPRNKLPDDHPLLTGLKPKKDRVALKVPLEGATDLPLVGAPYTVDSFVSEFPFKLDKDDIRRGMERYTIFCTPCHSPLGDGKGKIVERGFLKPPSYHTDPSRGYERFRKVIPLRDAPIGYYFEVVSKGFGGMPEFASEIPADDRWRIIAYVRTLQLSQAVNLADLDPAVREATQHALDEAGKKAPGGHP